MTILNVDDDLEDIEIFCEAVNAIDPTILCIVARSAEEALRILNSDIELPSYIFLDINMPKIDGNACLREIKKDDRLKRIPVIMYSTHNSQMNLQVYKELNTGFLVKQNSFNALVQELKKLLSKKQ